MAIWCDVPETTHQEYQRLRRECGYQGDGIIEAVWYGCDAEAQQSMLGQMRAGAEEVARNRLYDSKRGAW
jgi:hypothetical protein